jgi:hypothetical protein
MARVTDRKTKASFDHQGRDTYQQLLPWSPPNLDEQNGHFLCLVPLMSHAGMNLVPRFDQAKSPHAWLITSVLGWLTWAILKMSPHRFLAHPAWGGAHSCPEVSAAASASTPDELSSCAS